MLGLPILFLAQVISVRNDGDLRESGFPLLVALAATGWLVCTVTIWLRHEGHRPNPLNAGVILLIMGLIGTALGFGAIWIGALLAIEEGTGPAGWIVVIAIATGIITLPLGLLLTGIGIIRATILLGWGRWLPLSMVALVPAGMLAFGVAEGVAESVVGFIWFILFAGGWALLGWNVRPLNIS